MAGPYPLARAGSAPAGSILDRVIESLVEQIEVRFAELERRLVERAAG